MERAIHKTAEELEAGLTDVFRSPKDRGVLEMIVSRPGIDKREVLDAGELNVAEGLRGDNWRSRNGAGDSPHPDTQLTIMNARVITLIAGERDRWQLAGDQLYIDLDLSPENLPVGQRLSIGSALIEITDTPHLGCGKFAERFGHAAARFVNSPAAKKHRVRGIYARVIQPGAIHVSDVVKKVEKTVPTT
jgi:MOSC domain-containing protein YiiM